MRTTPLTYEERLEKANALMQAEQVSVRNKFFGGRWWLMLYRVDPKSPTGVVLGAQIYDDPRGRELVTVHGYFVRPANSLCN